MIVTCSNCEARYAVDPLAIGPGGRTVQCARCSHRWFQRVEGPKPAPDQVIRPARVEASLPVPVPPKPKTSWGKRFASAVGLLVVVGVVGAGYFYRSNLLLYRDKILTLPPFEKWASPRMPASTARAPAPTAAAPADRADTTATPAKPATPPPAKADAVAGPAQLEVDLAASKIDLIEGRYVVRGEITNRGGSPGAATKLIVTFKKGNEVLDIRTYPLALGTIPAGDRLTFSQTLDNPPAGATEIVPAVE